jgi:hypothetical protein
MRLAFLGQDVVFITFLDPTGCRVWAPPYDLGKLVGESIQATTRRSRRMSHVVAIPSLRLKRSSVKDDKKANRNRHSPGLVGKEN